MSLSASLREKVRRRAGYACEFCGISETDTGGMLTIDHFQPQSQNGSDRMDNLIYACAVCNQYKQDYWPTSETAPVLWNPRQESGNQHFVEQEDGQLIASTTVGEFTIKRLRLNRNQLVAARQRRKQQLETRRLLLHYQELVALQAQVQAQLTYLATEQQMLLQEQRKWLLILLEQHNRKK